MPCVTAGCTGSDLAVTCCVTDGMPPPPHLHPSAAGRNIARDTNLSDLVSSLTAVNNFAAIQHDEWVTLPLCQLMSVLCWTPTIEA